MQGSSSTKIGHRLLIVTAVLVILSVIFNFAETLETKIPLLRHYTMSFDWAMAILWFLLGMWLVRYGHQAFKHRVPDRQGTDVRAWFVISRIISTVGYAFVLLVALHLLHIQISSILLGGAVTGVIVGIAAQSTLNNLFAGFLLLTLRPFSIGQNVTFRTSSFDVTGKVVDVNWYYSVVLDGDRRRILPNASVITAIITIHPEQESVVTEIPVPYDVSPLAIAALLNEGQDVLVTLRITSFQTDTYTLEVTAPADFDLFSIVQALAISHGTTTQ